MHARHATVKNYFGAGPVDDQADEAELLLDDSEEPGSDHEVE